MSFKPAMMTAGSHLALNGFPGTQHLDAEPQRNALAAAMIDLPLKYRARKFGLRVGLRQVMGLDHAEAARELDPPLNTFKSHLLRGTKLLREVLADRLEPEPPPAVPFRVEPAAVSGNGHHRGEFGVDSEQPLRHCRAGMDAHRA